jgi:hypothetical protein
MTTVIWISQEATPDGVWALSNFLDLIHNIAKMNWKVVSWVLEELCEETKICTSGVVSMIQTNTAGIMALPIALILV